MSDLLAENTAWKEEQDRKIAAFLDHHAPRDIATTFGF